MDPLSAFCLTSPVPICLSGPDRGFYHNPPYYKGIHLLNGTPQWYDDGIDNGFGAWEILDWEHLRIYSPLDSWLQEGIIGENNYAVLQQQIQRYAYEVLRGGVPRNFPPLPQDQIYIPAYDDRDGIVTYCPPNHSGAA